MDLQNAAMLGGLVFVMVEFAKRLIPIVTKSDRLTTLTVLIIGQVAVFLAASTVWAHEQIVGDHPLTDLNVGSKVVAGLFISAIATGINVLVGDRGAIRDIGETKS